MWTYLFISGGAGGNAARGQIYMGAPIGVVKYISASEASHLPRRVGRGTPEARTVLGFFLALY